MTLDVALLQHLRLGTHELWRGMCARVGLRLLLALVVVHAAFYGMLWLFGEALFAGRQRDLAVGLARILLPVAGVCAGCAMALVDSLSALIVSGPFLRSMGDLFLCARAKPIGPEVTAEFGVFGSPRALAGMARIRDLPLIVFLARIVLGVNVKPLVQAAPGGLDAETLVHELERQARDRAAGMLRRFNIYLYILLSLAALVPFLVAAFLG